MYDLTAMAATVENGSITDLMLLLGRRLSYYLLMMRMMRMMRTMMTVMTVMIVMITMTMTMKRPFTRVVRAVRTVLRRAGLKITGTHFSLLGRKGLVVVTMTMTMMMMTTMTMRAATAAVATRRRRMMRRRRTRVWGDPVHACRGRV